MVTAQTKVTPRSHKHLTAVLGTPHLGILRGRTVLSPREEHGFAWGQGCRALGWSCGAFSLLFARLKESKRPFHKKNQDSSRWCSRGTCDLWLNWGLRCSWLQRRGQLQLFLSRGRPGCCDNEHHKMQRHKSLIKRREAELHKPSRLVGGGEG